MTDDLSPSLALGIEQFNQRQFYACHDTLEAVWMNADAFEKSFYQGILQIAVALYHLGNHNWQGSVTLMGEGIHRLRPFYPSYEEVDVQTLITQTTTLLKTLQESGPQEIEAIAQQLEHESHPLSYPIIRHQLETH
jgi:predicted metal-dependent hydrolase